MNYARHGTGCEDVVRYRSRLRKSDTVADIHTGSSNDFWGRRHLPRIRNYGQFLLLGRRLYKVIFPLAFYQGRFGFGWGGRVVVCDNPLRRGFGSL